MTRKFSKAVGALLVLGLLSPSLALADPISVAPDAGAATTVAATDVAQAGPLSDVPQNSWAYDAVNQLVKDGIIKGYPDGTFKGNRPMTRYEAAVMAYRAVDMLEAQITAGKGVKQSDLDAANKLLAAYGAELKAVERHVDALQQEADATKKVTATEAAQIAALNDFNRKASIHITDIFSTFAYGGNVNANCGPGAYAGNGGSVAVYCATTFGGNALLPGVKTGGYQPTYGNDPPSGNLPNGQRNSGLGFNYFKLTLSGNPSPNTAFLMELGNSSREVDTSGRATQTAYCIPTQNFLNGNAAEPSTLSNCSVVNASQSAYNGGETGFLPSFNNLWIQSMIPNSGMYLRVGHVQNNEGPTGGSWLGGDYYWGGQLGLTKGSFNGYIGYGVGNSATTNNTMLNVPTSYQALTIEADNTFNLGKGAVNVGVMYANYTGSNSNMWDPSAVICTGAGGTVRLFANTAAVPFTSCGAGFLPVTYVNGAPITGAYLSAQNNNPTLSGTAAPFASFGTPGLIVNNPISMIAGHLIFTYGKARLYLAGTYHLGNDPYTRSAWIGPTSGDFVADYGPFRAGAGNARKWTYEAQGFSVGFNGSLPNTNDFGGPILDNTWTTNWSGLYWLEAGVKYWLSDNTNLAVGYGHAGLNPNTLLPAGNSGCPGCVISGYTQNAGFLQMNMNF